jgi:hypothetical protein
MSSIIFIRNEVMRYPLSSKQTETKSRLAKDTHDWTYAATVPQRSTAKPFSPTSLCYTIIIPPAKDITDQLRRPINFAQVSGIHFWPVLDCCYQRAARLPSIKNVAEPPLHSYTTAPELAVMD